MATLTIGDKKVTVDDSFLKLSPEQQQTTVNEIAASIGVQGTPKRELSVQEKLQQEIQKASVFQPPNPAARVEGNAQRSDLPGPLSVLNGFNDFSKAFQSGATQGMTANFADEIYAGVSAPFRAGYNMLSGQADGFDIGRGFKEGMESGGRYLTDTQALNPDAARAGNLTGGVVLGGTLSRGGMSLIPSTQASLLRLGLTGAAEGGLYGAAYGFGEGNSIDDRLSKAVQGALTGAAAGAVLGPTVGAVMNPNVPKSAEILNRGFVRDAIDPATIPQRLSDLGPDSAIADLGPNMQAQAAAIATQPGNGMGVITDFMRRRAEAARGRISGQIDQTLGPSRPIPSIQAAIEQQMENLGPRYTQALQSAQRAPDVTQLAQRLDGNIQLLRGAAQRAARDARAMLNETGTNNLTRSPEVLFEARKALDAQIAVETNANAGRVLSNIRRDIDAELARVVPDIKRVDADYAELARQRDALQRGTQVMDNGKEAMAPQTWDEMMRGSTRAQNARLSEGARAEVERIIGTKGSDRVALQQIIKGEGSWNYERLASTFGRDRAEQLFRILQNERTLATTEAQAIAGARTSPLISAKADLEQQVRPVGVFEEAANVKLGTAAVKLADKMFRGMTEGARTATIQEVAQELIRNGLSPQMANNIAILRASNRPVTPQMLAAYAASGPSLEGAAP